MTAAAGDGSSDRKVREVRDVLGVVLAGGQSTRYGSPKALAMVQGRRVVDRVADAMQPVAGDVVAIVNDESLARSIGLPWRSDRTPGLGPVAGLDAALAWAQECGCTGILACACDMPFLDAGLLAHIVTRAAATGADAVLPESDGPRGVEPLAACYAVSCLAAIEAASQRGDHRLIGFHSDIHVERIPLTEVRSFGDPAVLFMNLNTPADRDAADAAVKRA